MPTIARLKAAALLAKSYGSEEIPVETEEVLLLVQAAEALQDCIDALQVHAPDVWALGRGMSAVWQLENNERITTA